MTDDTAQTRRFGPRVSVYREDLDCVLTRFKVLMNGRAPQLEDLRKLNPALAALKRANAVFVNSSSVDGHIKQLKEDDRLLADARENPGNSMLGSAMWVAGGKNRQRWMIETEIAEAVWQIDHAANN